VAMNPGGGCTLDIPVHHHPTLGSGRGLRVVRPPVKIPSPSGSDFPSPPPQAQISKIFGNGQVQAQAPQVGQTTVVSGVFSKAGRGKKHEGKGEERERTQGESKHEDGRHTHESDLDSDEEEKSSKARLRPPHVPGSLGLLAPQQSAIGQKLALASVAVPAPVSQKGGPKADVRRPPVGFTVRRSSELARSLFLDGHMSCRRSNAQAHSECSAFAFCHCVGSSVASRGRFGARGGLVRVLCVPKVHLVVSAKRWASSFEEGEHG
jgi:hypothetical protein